jgi:multimeric flavodoxin WrbA
MTKTIVFMASPRLQSNTDILANKIIDGLREEGNEDDKIEKVDLVEYKEYVCCACGQCRDAGECLQFPEITELLDAIIVADNLVLTTPTWWLAPSSYLKIFIDHWGAFLRPDYTSRIAGKKAVIASCCGDPEVNFAEQVCTGLSDMLSFLQVDVVGTLGVKGVNQIGEVSKDSQALDKAYELGKKLAAS